MTSEIYKKNESSILAAVVFVEWAKNRIHRIEVPNPNLRKRLSWTSFGISIDLCDSIQVLCMSGSKTGAFVLLRSSLENYYRGLWIAYVANEETMKRILEGRETKTLKNLIKIVRAADIPSIETDDLIGLENKVSILDDLAHGGTKAINSRNPGGYEVGSSGMNKNDIFVLLSMSCSTIWLCVEHIIRVSFENEADASLCREEGSILFKKLMDTFEIEGNS
ncbi:hypothetical protein MGA5115_00685 [Marinomonas gallaica]|uniref:Uncharacterized protein n=1 Tax=Marinomonas gallaica TaxID=1806667 RepID=A0A1C3JN72_9GAMM|nr:hypothetical protein [Marinomonas gallaica]SBT16604.1 hypothetical protein MGA5115_00685 [Marinomonas gallaica]SBT20320.1 hypothetical protein MGA5116_00903 [Marinomonas gallaica]